MDVHELLRRYNLRPSKGLAQNLLISDWAYERIVSASELTADDHVLEIGPGLGTLTRRLASSAGYVTAVELDHRMVEVLQDTVGALPNVTIVEGDILRLRPQDLLRAGRDPSATYKVVANLPYYITSRVLRLLLTAAVRPALLTLLVQKEVADRVVAGPGEMSLLALSVQACGAPRRVATVPASAFYPQPKVASAILSIRTYAQPLVPPALEPCLYRIAHAAFGQRRKQLHNSLTANLPVEPVRIDEALETAGILPEQRPQSLALADWVRLAELLCPHMHGSTDAQARSTV
ncbi:MAG: 16S rRNA (adenine(1518)-N(6)/adenine(1519)-N(6))-dimethyltransferase RsmA [Anaerolineae bacterium]|nr:ribosomal RNA small subunit methyltransferase A [Chloroflexota bacterium]